MPIVDDLDLESAAFELRYNNAYLLWDVVGTIWSKMLVKHPELAVTNVQPNQQIFETTSLQIALELGLFRVLGRGSDAIEHVAAVSSDLYEILSQHLQLSSFTRAGFRLIRSKSFATPADAMTFANRNDQQSPNIFGGAGKEVGFSISHRFERESSGLLANLKIEDREININIQWEAIPYLNVVKGKKTYFIADTDYYTIGVIDRETLDVATWIRQANKAIRRHWEAV